MILPQSGGMAVMVTGFLFLAALGPLPVSLSFLGVLFVILASARLSHSLNASLAPGNSIRCGQTMEPSPFPEGLYRMNEQPRAAHLVIVPEMRLRRARFRIGAPLETNEDCTDGESLWNPRERSPDGNIRL
jgi:hypothetical protein